MNSHTLAKLLLKLPDIPIGTHALGNSYFSKSDKRSNGPLHVGIYHHYDVNHLVIGDFDTHEKENAPNWFLEKLFK